MRPGPALDPAAAQRCGPGRVPTHVRAPALLVCALLVLLVGTAPAAAGKRTVPHGFYGAMWDGPGTGAARADAQWGRMAASGVESVRTVFSWAAAEPTPGTTDFTTTDRLVANAARRRMRLLPVVIYTPDWAKADQVENAPPASPHTYAAFVGRLVARYGRRGSFWTEHPELPRRPVREWQLWNEPHVRAFWNYPGGKTRPTAWVKPYGTMVRASARAIRRGDRKAKVVLAGMTNDAWNHLDRLLRRGRVRGYFDVAALQTYTGTPAKLLRAVNLVRERMRRRKVARLPLWLTEMSWPAAKGRITPPAYQRSIVTSDRGMARRVKAAYSLLARKRRRADVRVGRVYWFTWSSTYDAEENSVFRFAGLTRFDGERFRARPALWAYRAMARRHQGCAKTSTGRCR